MTRQPLGGRSAHLARAALLGAVALLVAAAGEATTCPQVRVCIAIDGSGSIYSSDFSLMKTGLAEAVQDPTVVPQNGTVEFAFIEFGSISCLPHGGSRCRRGAAGRRAVCGSRHLDRAPGGAARGAQR